MSRRRSKSNAEQLISKNSAKQPGQAHLNLPKISESIADGSTVIAVQATMRASSLDDSSAARPAQKSDGPAELLRLQECNEWLQALPSQQLFQSRPLQRLQAAMVVLQGPSSRQQRQDVQQLLDTWGVVKKAHNRKRKYDEVKKDFITQVVEETRRLKRMNDAFAGPCPDGSANNASACFSAIRASLHHGSIERLP